MNEYERNARHNSVDPPRVYKLVREKQKQAPIEQDRDKDYVYRGNQLDLQPLFVKEGKYRIPGNLSQIQYASALRNYKIIDYNKLAEESQHLKDQEEMKRFSKVNHTIDHIAEERSLKEE